MAELKVFTVLSEISALLDNSRKVPLSNLVMVDRDRMNQLLDKLEACFDPDLEMARKLLAKEAEVLDGVNRRAKEISEKAAADAEQTTNTANANARKMVEDAKQQAEDTLRQATDRANQMLAGAQAQANQMIASAQMQANQMVEENEITQRAQARAVEITEAAQQESSRLQQETLGTLSQLLEHADIGLGAQLDALRTMRQQLGAGYIDPGQMDYQPGGYPQDGYGE